VTRGIGSGHAPACGGEVGQAWPLAGIPPSPLGLFGRHRQHNRVAEQVLAIAVGQIAG
jgi:hypothetical protein